MGRFEYLTGQRANHSPVQARKRPRAPLPGGVVASEWAPAPLSRLGRLLWADVEHYLEFIAIAREGTEPEPPLG